MVGYKEDGHNLVRVVPFESGKYRLDKSWNIEVNDSIKNVSIYCVPKYETNIIMYSQNSLKSPYSIYKLDLTSGESSFERQKPVPKYDSSLYDTERQYATSPDGTQVPISIVYRKDMFKTYVSSGAC